MENLNTVLLISLTTRNGFTELNEDSSGRLSPLISLNRVPDQRKRMFSRSIAPQLRLLE